MQFQLRLAGCDEFATSAQAIQEIVTKQLRRFERRVRQVQLYIEDVNGPRGGVDKQCRCVLHLRRSTPIVIRDSDESLMAMVHRVADRASFALSRDIERRYKPKSHGAAESVEPDDSN